MMDLAEDSKENEAENEEIMGALMVAAAKVAKTIPALQNGYRIVNNTGKHAFQTIHNMYLHVIGG